jgi:glutathione S-transferase
MTDEIVFYTNPQSRGRIARWALEESGAPYRTEYLDFAAAMKTPAYLAVNPMGKVPAITHRGEVVTECAAICAYLADAFPAAKLAPPVDARARYYRWLFFAAGPIEAAVTNKALQIEVSAERERMVGYGNMDHVLDALEGALDGREYLASDSFTAADLYVGSQLSFGLLFKSIEPRPSFLAYTERLQARHAYKRAAELDDAAIAQTQSRAEA